jgi:hypothetical protein
MLGADHGALDGVTEGVGVVVGLAVGVLERVGDVVGETDGELVGVELFTGLTEGGDGEGVADSTASILGASIMGPESWVRFKTATPGSTTASTQTGLRPVPARDDT